MHVRAARRPHLGHLHPSILAEAGGHDLVGVFHVAMSGDGNRLRHLEHKVRVGNIPARGPVRRRRRVAWISHRRMRISPGRERGNLLCGKRRIVREASVCRVSKPRRHLFGANFFADRVCPAPRLLVVHQRHGRNLARAVAPLAVLLQNGKHVAIKGRR